MQPAPVKPSRQIGVAFVSLGEQGIVWCQVNDGVELGVDAVDARQVTAHHLTTGNLFGVNGC